MRILRSLLLSCLLVFSAFTSFSQDTVSSPVMMLNGNKSDVEVVLYSPNGNYLVSGGWDNMIRVWNNDSAHTFFKEFKAHDAAVKCAFFSRDSKLLITGSIDNSARVWDSSFNVKYSLFGHQLSVNAVMIDPRMKFVFTGSADGTIKVWNMEKNAELVRTIKIGTPVNAMAMSITGADIFVGTKSPDIKQMNALGVSTREFKGHTDEINALAYALNNKYLISGSSDRTAIIWNLATGKAYQTLTGHTWKITAVGFSFDSKYAYTASIDGTVRLWDVEAGTLIRIFKGKGGEFLTTASMSPDITQIAGSSLNRGNVAAEYANTISIWNTKLELPKRPEKKPKGAKDSATMKGNDKGKTPGKDKGKSSVKKTEEGTPVEDNAPANREGEPPRREE